MQPTQHAQPETTDDLTDLFGEVISRYTREDALNDGYLVDVTETAKEAGITLPTVVTRAVWDQYIEWDSEDSDKQTYQDQSGRLWDVLWMCRHGIGNNREAGQLCQLLFELYCIPRDGKTRRAERTLLKVHVGPGDHGEPVLTILLPNED